MLLKSGKFSEKGREVGSFIDKLRALLKLHFIVPFLFLVVVFYFIPVVITFLISFTNMSSFTGFSNWHWVGFKNYAFILKNPETAQHFWLTVKYVIFTLIFFNVGLAFVLAIATTHIPRRWGYFFRSLWLLPRITPVVVYIMMWQFLVADAPYGVINQLFIKPLGLQPQNWMAVFPFLMIVLVNGFVGASFGMIIFTSAIESIPKDIMNAALIDGATIFQRIRYVIIPYLKWPLLFVLTYQTLSLLTSFEQILILTNGEFGTEVWALWAYHKALSNYWGNFQWGFGMALSAILVLVGVAFSIIYMKFFKFNELVKKPKIETL